MGLQVALGVASLAFSAYSSYTQAQSQKNWAEYNAAVARNNAKIAEMQANDAIERGKLERQAHERKVRALYGKQTAALSKNGLDLNSGSPQNILSDTELFGQMDANSISQDAERKAWAYRVQASNDEAQAQGYDYQADSTNPMMAAGGSILSGAGSVASKWLSNSTPSSGYGYDIFGGSGSSGPGIVLNPNSDPFNTDQFWKVG